MLDNGEALALVNEIQMLFSTTQKIFINKMSRFIKFKFSSSQNKTKLKASQETEVNELK